MERREFIKGLIGIMTASTALDTLETEAATNRKQSNILLEASTWSELAEVLPKCMAEFEKQGEYNVFGYASIIGNHKDIQPAGSTHTDKNPQARLYGMEAAMNVFAVGPNEFRGTTDRKNGIYNVGLYAGLEPALNDGGYTEGVNIKLTKEEAIAGISAFITRELGKPPEGISLTDLFDANSGVKDKLAALPKNEFGLYKFQLVATEEAGVKKAAVVVSTNEKSPYSAIGLTPIQAAHFILDGQGTPRLTPDKTVMLGGTALAYFQNNVLDAYDNLGIVQPRIAEIKGAVFRLAYAYKEINNTLESEHLPQKDKVKRIEQICDDFGINGVHSRIFPEGAQVAQRADIQAEKEEFIRNGVPRTGDEKLKHVAKLFEQRAFDNLADDKVVNIR